MHRNYFPKCQVNGPIEPPAPFGHLGLQGAVPKKCSGCKHLFEGECLRGGDVVGRYLHLDHGPCGIPGNTDPVIYENQHIKSKVTVPRKCASCLHLRNDSIRGFYCSKDSDKWGDFSRGLDWGTWQPDHIYFDLPLPKITTRTMCELVVSDDLVGFVTEYRRVNPGRSLQEAKDDFKLMHDKLVDA